MEQLSLHPSLSIIEELYRLTGQVPLELLAMMDEIMRDDEEQHGEHSLEFRRGLFAGTYLTFLFQQRTPSEKSDLIAASIPAYFSGRFLELLEIMAPRPPLQ